ncbi:FCD domain-containing protein [Lactococcus cremoris]
MPWNTLIEQHKEILKAVENHDGEQAVSAAAKHLHLMFDEEMAVLKAFPEYFDNLPE